MDQAGILSRIAEVVENEADQDSLGVNAITKLYGKLGASGEVDFISLDMKYRILTQLEKLMVGDDDFEPEESLKVSNSIITIEGSGRLLLIISSSSILLG